MRLIFDVNKFLDVYPVWRRPRAVMSDGFSISIQASMYHYCCPQENSADFYTEVELGFPSVKEDLIMDYIDGSDDDPTNSAYAYVPVEVVNEIIKKHGGIQVNLLIKMHAGICIGSAKED